MYIAEEAVVIWVVMEEVWVEEEDTAVCMVEGGWVEGLRARGSEGGGSEGRGRGGGAGGKGGKGG